MDFFAREDQQEVDGLSTAGGRHVNPLPPHNMLPFAVEP